MSSILQLMFDHNKKFSFLNKYSDNELLSRITKHLLSKNVQLINQPKIKFINAFHS